MPRKRDDTQSAASYNYERFALDPRSMDRLDGPLAGAPAPDFEAVDLDGSVARLSDFRGRPVVLETGSLTCPMYVGRIRAMNALATQFPEVTFLVLYTREAHPGERTGPHRSVEEKLANARKVRDLDGEHRTILVDDLAGTAHRGYGSMPNTVHLITADGIVAYRAMWNEPDAVGRALRHLCDGEDPGMAPARLQLVSLLTAVRVFARGGLRALLDAARAIPALARLRRSR